MTTKEKTAITPAQIAALQQTIERLQEAAADYADQYELWPINHDSPEFRYVDGDSVVFAVESYCRGYSSTEYISVPLRWFEDRDAYTVEREQADREWAEQQARERAEEEAAKTAAKEERERAQYERLRQKFEGSRN